MGGQPDYSGLPVVFAWTALGVWIMNNYVRSTLGKSLNAIRDDEVAAEAMSVDTRHTKMTAFMFAAFWAGVAGGLFAHVMRFVNPATFGVQRLAEMLAMVYFGGLNSVYGSIVGAVSMNLLGEALRPLELFKWIFIPLLLILVMIFRPTGLVAFKDFDAVRLVRPRELRERPELKVQMMPALRSRADDPLLRRASGRLRLQSQDPGREGVRTHRSERRRQDHHLQSDHRHLPSHRRPRHAGGEEIDRPLRRTRSPRAAWARTFQDLQLWRHMTVLDHVKLARYSKLSYGLIGAFLGTRAPAPGGGRARGARPAGCWRCSASRAWPSRW